MSPAERALAAAQAAVGARFRLHGRDPAIGLDCVGLAALAMRAGGMAGAVPGDYALRGGDPRRIIAEIDRRLARGEAPACPGDLLLCAGGPAQFHFAIQAADGVIHADAVLRRVVARPGPVPWPIIGIWRLPETGE
jgi:cell wall-associated NlpC family hydrolase